MEETLSSSNIKDPRSSVEQVRKEIAELQAQVDEATRESQQLMSQIYEWNGKLSESRTVGHNFAVLRQQYQSDIRRIGFIVDGAATVSPVRKKLNVLSAEKKLSAYRIPHLLMHPLRNSKK